MKRIAIIGTGISGLVCARLLHQEHEVQVFEANDYIGGHTATVDVETPQGQFAIDTGFIVFNDRTYPNFIKLLHTLGVAYQDSEMSFSVKNDSQNLEYNGHSISTLFAQKRNYLNPKFYSLIRQILKFNKACKQRWQDQDIKSDETLGSYIKQLGLNDYFATNYILPMGAAIWSASLDESQQMPLEFFIRFFVNHGLLNVSDRPQWFVVKDGSRSYIPALIAGLEERIHLNSPVQSVKRLNQGVELTINGEVQHFDDVVLACHSDQSLSMLSDATNDEQKVLSQLKYQNNEVVLHTDVSLLPKRRAAWAAWNYGLNGDSTSAAAVTYNMNILQGLDEKAPTFCVTLNQTQSIDPSKILRSFNYAHPMFNHQSIQAQQQRNLICGKSNTHFAGAYWYNGFHEDGVRSALDVCQRFGLTLESLLSPKTKPSTQTIPKVEPSQVPEPSHA
ncbi:FAD-dependent oxidoreductase [Alginatibacterium sediminis]|uniref:FAD-dependent oxidoreductase n=1 Tax=Alginatibacterium sediminis TaxID=2164068 RepID=A0A420E8I4_9ALTE|nr:FAD-dependent oxidoreductase [Alginatibacterium sediminis]RKF15710.1 FAD-dependent oxidoreductase [Alginatibacterium sediminis]